MLVVNLEERISCLNHEKGIVLRSNVEDSVIKVHDAMRFCHQGVLALLLRNENRALLLDYYLADSNVA